MSLGHHHDVHRPERSGVVIRQHVRGVTHDRQLGGVWQCNVAVEVVATVALRSVHHVRESAKPSWLEH